MGHKPRLVDQLKAAPPNQRVPLRRRLTDEQWQELLEVREAWQRGELRHLSVQAIVDALAADWGVQLSRETLARFLNAKKIPENSAG